MTTNRHRGALLVTVGERLAAIRRERGMGQVEVGEAVGLNHATLSLYENGKRAPALATLVALARLYGVPLSDIITEEDE